MWTYQYADRIALETLALTDLPDPRPGPFDVVIRMRAAALNHQDIALAQRRYHIEVTPPLIPLSDGAGEVIAVGSDVTRFRVGDLAAPIYLPDWIDGPVTPRAGRRRLGGPTDGTLRELSLAVLQIAKRAGARVVVLTRDENHSDDLEKLGADVVLPLGQAAGWASAVVAEKAGPRG